MILFKPINLIALKKSIISITITITVKIINFYINPPGTSLFDTHLIRIRKYWINLFDYDGVI